MFCGHDTDIHTHEKHRYFWGGNNKAHTVKFLLITFFKVKKIKWNVRKQQFFFVFDQITQIFFFVFAYFGNTRRINIITVTAEFSAYFLGWSRSCWTCHSRRLDRFKCFKVHNRTFRCVYYFVRLKNCIRNVIPYIKEVQVCPNTPSQLKISNENGSGLTTSQITLIKEKMLICPSLNDCQLVPTTYSVVKFNLALINYYNFTLIVCLRLI